MIHVSDRSSFNYVPKFFKPVGPNSSKGAIATPCETLRNSGRFDAKEEEEKGKEALRDSRSEEDDLSFERLES